MRPQVRFFASVSPSWVCTPAWPPCPCPHPPLCCGCGWRSTQVHAARARLDLGGPRTAGSPVHSHLPLSEDSSYLLLSWDTFTVSLPTLRFRVITLLRTLPLLDSLTCLRVGPRLGSSLPEPWEHWAFSASPRGAIVMVTLRGQHDCTHAPD